MKRMKNILMRKQSQISSDQSDQEPKKSTEGHAAPSQPSFDAPRFSEVNVDLGSRKVSDSTFLRRLSLSQKLQSQSEGEIKMEKGRGFENPHRCMSPEVIYLSSEFTPGLGRRVPELVAAGGGFFEIQYGVSSDQDRPRSRSFAAPSSARTAPKKRYTMIIDLGSGKDIPESNSEVTPKFSFELENDSEYEQ